MNLKTRILRSTLILAACCVAGFSSVQAQNAPTFNAGQSPLPADKVWQKINELSDEFNDGSLNTAKWEDGPHSRFPWNGQQPSVFLPENVSEGNGSLNIEHTVFENNPRNIGGSTRWYGGGIVRSKASASTGTYYEARVRAGHTPFSTAFWIINSRGEGTTSICNRTTELDILECIGRRSTAYTGNYGFATNWVGQMHSNILARETTCAAQSPNNTNKQYTQTLGGPQNWQAYQIYGAWISEDGRSIQFFLNGQAWGGVKTIANGGIPPNAPFDATKMYVTMSSNLYAWNRGLNSNPSNVRADPQFIVNRNGQQYWDTNADELSAAGRTERSANFDWVRCWKIEDATTPPPPSSDEFFIVNRATGKKIRIPNNVDNTKVEQVPFGWSGPPTRWRKVPSNDGNPNFFYLQNVSTGKYFRPTVDAEDSPMIQKNPAGFSGSFTQWEEVPVPGNNTYVYLKNRGTEDYMRPETNQDFSDIVQKPISFSGQWTQWQLLSTSAKVANTKIDKTLFDFYPNPASETLNIEVGDSAFEVSIFDINGRRVKHLNLESNTIQEVSVSDLKAGIYLMNYKNDTQASVSKLVIR